MAKAKKIIYPRQTAIWLRDNTKLSTKQVATFCSMVEEEVIFAREPSTFNPINVNISQDEIEIGEKNPRHKLKALTDFAAFQTKRVRKNCQMNAHKYKKPSYFKYILANRNGRPICFTLVGKLLGRKPLTLVKEFENPDGELDMLDPVEYDLCSQDDLEGVYKNCACEICKDKF
jgi:hypothetical protein